MEKKQKHKMGILSSISGKIILAIIGTNLIVMMIVAGIVGVMLSQNVGGLSEDFAIQQVKSYSNLFEQNFSDIETAVKLLSNQMAMVTDLDKAKANPSYLKTIQEEYAPIIQHIGNEIGITRSIYVYYNIEMFQGEYDIWFYNDGNGFKRQDPLGLDYYEGYNEWYNEPIDQGRSVWSFPYTSETGGLITSYVTPIVKDGVNIGVVGMDLYLDDIQKILEDTILFESGYLYLMTEEGNFVYHPNHPWADDGTPSNILHDTNNQEVYEKLLADMKANESLFTTYERDDGEKVVAAFTHLRNGWVLSSSIPRSEVMKIVNGVLLILVVITLITVVVAFGIAVIVGKTISKPILEVVRATEVIKEGDFTVQVQSKSKDETRLLADALNAMTRNVQNLIREAKLVSKEMLDSASGLAAITQETNATVEQVASTVGEIAKGTQDTASSAEKGAIATQIIDQKFTSLMDNNEHMLKNVKEAVAMNE
ncbi:MAG: methyl-accepting chemotaxis protein, partial [Vallitaleaceae bacterium]|nr:methyl-accepting chemotaxis protein [Vallitaleaceae bacterium]